MAQQMLLDWLSGPVMTELAASQAIAPGLPKPFPAKLYDFSPAINVGVNVQWDSMIGQRAPAQAVDYLSPARQIQTQARQRVQAVALGTREKMVFDTEFILAIQSNVPLWQNRSRDLMRQRMQDFRFRADNFMCSLVHSAISQGQISLDRNGNILPTTAGATVVVNYSSTYGTTGALTKTSAWPNQTTLVGDWSSPSTDIPASARAMQQSFAFTSNYQPVHAIYGKSIPSFMYNNTALQTYMSRSQMVGTQFLETNEVPAGMLDMQWHPGYKAYYVDANGVVQPWVADNQIIIIPEIDPWWYENLLCSMPCPQGILQPTGDIEAALAMCPPVRGYSSYTSMSWDPILINAIAQVYSLPIQKAQLASYNATVS